MSAPRVRSSGTRVSTSGTHNRTPRRRNQMSGTGCSISGLAVRSLGRLDKKSVRSRTQSDTLRTLDFGRVALASALHLVLPDPTLPEVAGMNAADIRELFPGLTD